MGWEGGGVGGPLGILCHSNLLQNITTLGHRLRFKYFTFFKLKASKKLVISSYFFR